MKLNNEKELKELKKKRIEKLEKKEQKRIERIENKKNKVKKPRDKKVKGPNIQYKPKPKPKPKPLPKPPVLKTSYLKQQLYPNIILPPENLYISADEINRGIKQHPDNNKILTDVASYKFKFKFLN